MDLEIEVKRNEDEVENLNFSKKSILIGRATGNDICIEIPGVSRYHARINIQGETVLIEDLGSTNGTLVNSQKISGPTQLTSNDVISIGNATLTLLLSEMVAEVEANQAEIEEVEEFVQARSSETNVGTTKKKPTQFLDSSDSQVLKNNTEKDFYWQSLKSFLAPIWQYIVDDNISEILINGPRDIYIERKGKLEKVIEHFKAEQLDAAILNIAQYVGRRVSEEEPYLDARLPDGSRVAVLMPPCSKKGAAMAIRKFSKEKLSLEKLLEFNSLSQEMAEYLKAVVILKKNIIVSGGTSSGKTSLLNVVSSLIPNDERIITIEDSAELQLIQEHVVPMETRPADKKGKGQIAIRDLVKASLRMRPDRIIVGEIRGGEALDLLQAMNTGHSGSMTTVHASSPQQALTRLETLALFSGLEIPIFALREQVSSAVEVIIQASRLPDHSRKVVCISEVEHLGANGEYKVRDIFKFVSEGMKEGKVQGKHAWTGNVSGLVEEMKLAGLEDALSIFKK